MKILKDSAIYVIGEFFSKIVPFLLLPYLSRKLGVEGFGELSYYQTYLALFGIFLLLGQDGAVARYFYFYGKRSLDLVLRAGYAYTIILGGIILLFCWLFKAEMIAYIVIASIFQSFIAVQLAIRQCQKQAINYTVIQILSGLLSTIFTIIMLEIFKTHLVEKRILALLLANIVVFFISYFLYSKNMEIKKKFTLKQYKSGLMYVFGFGFPLILQYGSGFLKGQADRLLIYQKYSSAELGLYAMGVNIALILTMLIIAINKAVMPYLYESLKKEKITFDILFRWMWLSLLIVPIPALICYFLPQSFFIWIFGDGFGGMSYFAVLFLFAKALSIPYLFLANYLFFYGKNKEIAFSSVLSVVVYLILLFIFAEMSINYIPYATIISEVVILPILYFFAIKVHR